MSEINDLIHKNAVIAYKQGVERERERIVKMLEPFAEHDEEMCYFEGKLICYPEDCSAEMYRWTLQLILQDDKQEV